jgi:hypothetical protein
MLPCNGLGRTIAKAAQNDEKREHSTSGTVDSRKRFTDKALPQNQTPKLKSTKRNDKVAKQLNNARFTAPRSPPESLSALSAPDKIVEIFAQISLKSVLCPSAGQLVP